MNTIDYKQVETLGLEAILNEKSLDDVYLPRNRQWPTDLVSQQIPWLVQDAIGPGMTVIAGSPGAGKSTLVFGLCLDIAGFPQTKSLAPKKKRISKRPRRIVFITEDPRSMLRQGTLRCLDNNYDVKELADQLFVMDSKRSDSAELSRLFSWLSAYHTPREVSNKLARQSGNPKAEGMKFETLIVLDTTSSNLDIESENDSANVSRALDAIRQNVGSASVWLISHVAKDASKGLKRDWECSDLLRLSSRGASSFEGDAHTVCVVHKDEITDTSYLVVKKSRDGGDGKVILSHKTPDDKHILPIIDEFGDHEGDLTTWRVDAEVVSGSEADVIIASRRAMKQEVERTIKAQQAQDYDRNVVSKIVQDAIDSTPKGKIAVYYDKAGNPSTPDTYHRIKLDRLTLTDLYGIPRADHETFKKTFIEGSCVASEYDGWYVINTNF